MILDISLTMVGGRCPSGGSGACRPSVCAPLSIICLCNPAVVSANSQQQDGVGHRKGKEPGEGGDLQATSNSVGDMHSQKWMGTR